MNRTKNAERYFPTVENYDFTRPRFNQRVDLATAAGLLKAAGFGDFAKIVRLEREYNLYKWETARFGAFGETFKKWCLYRYELSTYQNLSAPRSYHPQLLGYYNGQHMAMIWYYNGDEWEIAYTVAEDVSVP